MTQATFEQLLHQLGPARIVGFFLVLARVSPLFVLAPLFSSQFLPKQAKAIIAIGIAFGLTPLAMHGARPSTDALSIAGLAIENLLVGLAFSLAVGAVFAGVEAAGGLADVTSGFSYGALIDPIDNQQGGVLTTLYGMIGLALFVAVGGDAWTLRGLARTFAIVPLTRGPDMRTLTGGVVTAVGSIFVSALEVAAPVLLALLVTDIAFGMVSRVVPQLNILAVGLPFKIGVALLIVAAALPFIGGFMADQISSAVGTALQTI